MSYNTWMPNYGQQSGGYAPAWQGQMQGYPQQMQSQPVAAQSPQQGFYVRPVTNREEAVAAQIDFLSPGTFMPDFNNGRVYFKRFNPQTGACDFLTFSLAPPEQAEETQPQAPAPEYATKADLLEMREVVQGLAADIDSLRAPTRGGKRVAGE